MAHIKVHTGENDFLCSQCLNSFPSLYELNEHKMSVHGDGQNTNVFCEFCKIKFKSKRNLMKHMKRKHNSNEISKVCTPNGDFFRLDSTEPVNPVVTKSSEKYDPEQDIHLKKIQPVQIVRTEDDWI